MNTNRPTGGRILGDWFDDTFKPELMQLDRQRLLLWEVNGPLNLAPLFSDNNPIPANLRGYGAVPNSPVLPPPNAGDSSQTENIVIDSSGGGGDGEPGPPGPPGEPGGPGPDGAPGPDGDDVCTCAVEVSCSTSYKNTAKCRTSVKIEWQQGFSGDPPEPCGCPDVAEGWVESEVTWEGEHTSTSYFPPGYFSVADPAIANGLDGYGGSDYTAGVRQAGSAALSYEERITAKKGPDILTACGIEGSDGILPDSTCLPTCGPFAPEVWAFDTEATTAYRITWSATRDLTALGYVDDGDEDVTEVRCNPEMDDLPLGPTGDTSITLVTTIAPPLLCDGGPGVFPIGAEAPGTIPTEFIIPPACCSDCTDAGGTTGELGSAAITELISLSGEPSRCLFDYIGPPIPDPYPATSASTTNATITAVIGNGPITWSMGIEGNYSFVQEEIIDDWTGDCNDTRITHRCVWSGTMRWNADITILFVPEA